MPFLALRLVHASSRVNLPGEWIRWVDACGEMQPLASWICPEDLTKLISHPNLQFHLGNLLAIKSMGISQLIFSKLSSLLMCDQEEVCMNKVKSECPSKDWTWNYQTSWLLCSSLILLFNDLQNIYFVFGYFLFHKHTYQEDTLTQQRYDDVLKKEGPGRIPSLYRCIYAISWSEGAVWEYPIRRYFKKAKFPNLKIAT